MNTLVIRADSSEKIGAGHIMRCIALAQGWQESGGDVMFVISPASKPLAGRITSEGFSVSILDEGMSLREDASQTLDLARKTGARWVVIDGYQFGDEYQELVKEGGQKILVIDDYGHARNTHADIVVNPNIYASMVFYPHHIPATRYLLGKKYVLLRREFRKMREVSQNNLPPSATNILVSLGGSDPDNLTKVILDTIQPLIGDYSLSITAIVGMMNRHFSTDPVQNAGLQSLKIVHAPDKMPELISRADIVISGAGSTVWEVAFLGRPMIAVVLAGNQENVGHALQQAGAAMVIDDKKKVPLLLRDTLRDLLSSPEKCKEIAAAGMNLSDGEGPARVVMAMQEGNIRLREVAEDDKDLLLHWANDPVVRKNAFHENTIDPVTHEQWFEEKLHSSSSAIYIAVDTDEIPVGQIRFDWQGESAGVDISIDESRRGSGLGIELLRIGTAKIFHHTGIRTINAAVKAKNPASVAMFRRAGFSERGREMIQGNECVLFVLHRPHYAMTRK